MLERFSPRNVTTRIDRVNRFVLEKTHLERPLTHPATISLSAILMVWRGFPTYDGVIEKDTLKIATNAGIILASGFGMNTRLRIFIDRNPEVFRKIKQKVKNIVRHTSAETSEVSNKPL